MKRIRIGLSFLLVAIALGTIMAGCDSGDGGEGRFAGKTEEFVVAPSASTQELTAMGVTVVIPGGLLTATQTLKVTRITNPPDPIFKGLEMGGAYDIRLGDLHEFDSELTLRMKYDPVTLRTDIPIEHVISASSWDTLQEIWVATPATVDQANQEVVVKTRHLSVFSWFMKTSGYDVYFKNNFYLVYNKAEVTDPTFLRYYRNPDSSNYVDINVPNFVEDVMAFLIEAWKAYMDDAKFTAPPAPVDVYVGTDLSPLAEKFTGIVLISLLYQSPERVKMATAHELFHRVQNAYYYDLGGMVSLTWWLEATADYAGDWVAWKGLNLMGGEGGIKQKYLEAPLADTGEAHTDGYATAFFVKYLVDSGANFKDMWTATAAEASSVFVVWLDAYLKTVFGPDGGLLTQYRNFARYFLFDTNSPMPDVTDSLHTELAAYRTSMAASPQESATFTLRGGYTAKLWGIWFSDAAFDATKPKLKYSVSVDDPLREGVQLDVIVLKGDQRVAGGVTPLGTIAGAKKSVGVEVEKGDAVYVLAVNGELGEQTFKVKIVEEMFSKVHINMTVTEVRSFNGSIPTAELAGQNTPIMSGTLTGDTFTAVCDYVSINGSCSSYEHIDVVVNLAADRSKVTSFTLKTDVYAYHGDFAAGELPQAASGSAGTVFEVLGPEVCDVLTRYVKTNDTPGEGYDMSSYSCDDGSFIRVTFSE